MTRARRLTLLALLALAALAVLLAVLLRDSRDHTSPRPAATTTPAPTPSPRPGARPAPPAASQNGPGAPVTLAPAVAGDDPTAAHGAFAGRVIDWGTGRGVAGADLVFQSGENGITVPSAADGSFRFDAPAAGRYRLAVASADGYLPYAPAWNQSPIEVVARDGLRVEGLIVYLTPAIDYTGVVLAPDGKPVTGARVTLLAADRGERALLPIERSFTSGDDGEFVFHAPDFAVLRAEHDCCEPGIAELDGSAQVSHRLEIVLGRDARPAYRTRDDRQRETGDARVRGRVRSAGKPVASFSVAVLQKSGVAERVVATGTFFDAEGRFQVDGLMEGNYLVRAAAHGVAPSPAVSARASADPPEIFIDLPAGGTLFGKVVDGATGEPLELARISVEGTMGGGTTAVRMASSTVSDADGSFELPGLPPGRASVVAAAFGHHSRIVGGFEVAEGARIGPITIDLTPVAAGEKPKLELAGIGAALRAVDDGLEIVRIIDGGGAAEVGLVTGDVILSVDGASASELGFQGSIQRIRGPVDSTVLLTVRRQTGDVAEIPTPRRMIRT